MIQILVLAFELDQVMLPKHQMNFVKYFHELNEVGKMPQKKLNKQKFSMPTSLNIFYTFMKKEKKKRRKLFTHTHIPPIQRPCRFALKHAVMLSFDMLK